MNTSKQVNVMIGLLLLAFLGFAGYIVTEPARQTDAAESQRELHSYRGADIYVHSCANCHGPSGAGSEEGAIAPRLRRNAFLILQEDNPWGGPETPVGDATEIHDFLFNSIACGRTNTPMPLWSERYGGPLSETQIEYIVTMMTAGRWDMVDEIWHEYEEELRGDDEDWTVEDNFLVSAEDLQTMPMTVANCGQYPGASANPIRTRDPFAVGPGPTPPPTDDGNGEPPPVDGPAILMVDIDFTQDEITIPAGEAVDLPIRNDGVLPHDFSIDEIDAEYSTTVGTTDDSAWDIHVALNPGENGTLTLTVNEPGTYTFYCSVPGHREAGMDGTLIVQ